MNMSGKARLKLMIFVGVTAAAIPLGVLVMIVLSQFVAYFQQGADPASIFRGHALIIPQPEEARWVIVDDAEGESLRRAEQEQILAAYWSAWAGLSRAHQTGDISDLPTYWAGAAYDQAIAGVLSDSTLRLAHGGHQLSLTFFSDDRSVVAFEDERFILDYHYEGYIISVQASASVVMTQDQGFWRVRQIAIRFNSITQPK